jgi:membrane-associated phospholipid phosphatase
VTWARNRLDPHSPRGFWFTFTIAVAALALWAFAGLTQDVLGRDEMALVDPQFETWVAGHRIAWLSSAMQIVTWLGSAAVIVPLMLIVAAGFVARRRDWRSAALVVSTVLGATMLYNELKLVVGLPRPPVSLWIGHFSGNGFPSGHATQAAAFYGILAFVLSRRRSFRISALIWLTAVLIAILIGASRIYLGAHCLTDVLGGYALGTAWAAVVVAANLLLQPHDDGRRVAIGDSAKATAPANLALRMDRRSQ